MSVASFEYLKTRAIYGTFFDLDRSETGCDSGLFDALFW